MLKNSIIAACGWVLFASLSSFTPSAFAVSGIKCEGNCRPQDFIGHYQLLSELEEGEGAHCPEFFEFRFDPASATVSCHGQREDSILMQGSTPMAKVGPWQHEDIESEVRGLFFDGHRTTRLSNRAVALPNGVDILFKSQETGLFKPKQLYRTGLRLLPAGQLQVFQQSDEEIDTEIAPLKNWKTILSCRYARMAGQPAPEAGRMARL